MSTYPAVQISGATSLLEVSRSGYHAWRGRGPSPRERENARLLGEIRAIHSASDGNYGSPGVHEELREQGDVVSLNRVRCLMAAAEYLAPPLLNGSRLALALESARGTSRFLYLNL